MSQKASSKPKMELKFSKSQKGRFWTCLVPHTTKRQEPWEITQEITNRKIDNTKPNLLQFQDGRQELPYPMTLSFPGSESRKKEDGVELNEEENDVTRKKREESLYGK